MSERSQETKPRSGHKWKETAAFVIATALAVPGLADNNAMVALPCFFVSWLAFLYLCYIHDSSKVSRIITAIIITFILAGLGYRDFLKTYRSDSPSAGNGRPLFVIDSGYLYPDTDGTFRVGLDWKNAGDNIMSDLRGIMVIEDAGGEFLTDKVSLEPQVPAPKDAPRSITISNLPLKPGMFLTEFLTYKDLKTGLSYNQPFYFRVPNELYGRQRVPLDSALQQDIDRIKSKYSEEFQKIK